MQTGRDFSLSIISFTSILPYLCTPAVRTLLNNIHEPGVIGRNP